MKSENQKQKLLLIEKYLKEYTDENHPVSTAKLISYLEENGVSAERKSIYSDISTLQDFGLDVEKAEGNRGGYYLASREFELPEVKLLVDLVQSSKFITEKKSRDLIKKLESFVPHHDAVTLQRQVVVADRNKAVNESIYYSVDTIYEAMAENKKIQFHYFEWDENKKQALRKNGAFYSVSPWLLTWDDQKYYLVAFDSEAGILKHYRVDKMLHLSVLEEDREGKKDFDQVDVAAYGRKTFGMFAGQERTVRLSCTKNLIGVMVDRFGTEVPMRPLDKDHMGIRVDVSISNVFYGWLSSFGDQVRLIGPEDVADDYRNYIQSILEAGKE